MGNVGSHGTDKSESVREQSKDEGMDQDRASQKEIRGRQDRGGWRCQVDAESCGNVGITSLCKLLKVAG